MKSISILVFTIGLQLAVGNVEVLPDHYLGFMSTEIHGKSIDEILGRDFLDPLKLNQDGSVPTFTDRVENEILRIKYSDDSIKTNKLEALQRVLAAFKDNNKSLILDIRQLREAVKNYLGSKKLSSLVSEEEYKAEALLRVLEKLEGRVKNGEDLSWSTRQFEVLNGLEIAEFRSFAAIKAQAKLAKSIERWRNEYLNIEDSSINNLPTNKMLVVRSHLIPLQGGSFPIVPNSHGPDPIMMRRSLGVPKSIK